MSKVRRVYVEKKDAYAVRAKELHAEIKSYLGISAVDKVRVLIRYDIENISDDVYKRAVQTVFSEPPVDDVYEENFEMGDGKVFSVEFLPGQFDQRADSAEQCVKLLKEDEEPVIRTATTYVIYGDINAEQLEAIKHHCINPVDSRETGMEKPETLVTEFPEPADVKIMTGFKDMPEQELKALYDSLGLAMTFKDFLHIQNYFHGEEDRDPSMTEIRVLDTYWSDHCRHTTFSTELKNVAFEDGFYKEPMEKTYEDYLDTHKKMYEGRDDKFVCLMDIALMAMKRLKKEGKLQDQEESDEINACSIVVPVEVDGKTEEWLVNFKNETHNHPTEIEPFGGAATCLGGAIRDPLSGRSYVYQAMRVTGASDPLLPVDKTIPGKLPPRKITTTAAQGYSSYGNQIGLATGHVSEVYHPGYVAKRLEIGAVVPETIAAIRVNGLQRTLINLPQQSAVRCAWERFRHLRRLGYISGECGGGIERTHSLPRGHLIPLAPICSSNNGVGGGGHIMLGRVVKVHLGLPPIRSYCIGADVAASNLCISVGHPGGFAACQVRHITVEATIGNVPCNCSGYVGHPCCH